MCFQEIKLCLDDGASSGADDALLSAPRETLGRWRTKAESAIDALMLGDAPLLHPPAQVCPRMCVYMCVCMHTHMKAELSYFQLHWADDTHTHTRSH